MDWEECKEHIKETEQNEERIKSLKQISKTRLKALKQIIVDENTASIVTEQYYETIKELLTALMLKDGLKSDNHECLIAYFRAHYNYAYETEKLKELKKIRNKINYEGTLIDKAYLERNELEFKHIIKTIKELI